MNGSNMDTWHAFIDVILRSTSREFTRGVGITGISVRRAQAECRGR
jgi:hypothetical protein